MMQRSVCRFAAIAFGFAIMGVGIIEKIGEFGEALWLLAPLTLLWLLDIGSAAEQRRCIELLRKNPGKEDPAAWIWEGGDVAIFRFFRSSVSLSVSPFYIVLFCFLFFGGQEIVRINKEQAARSAHELALGTPAPTPYAPVGTPIRVPSTLQRPILNSSSFNNQPVQRFTPPPFSTPPRVAVPASRMPTTPPKSVTPASSPVATPTTPAATVKSQ